MSWFAVPALFAVIGLTLWLNTALRRGGRGRYDEARKFLDDDAAANASRAKPIPAELFFTADASRFPTVYTEDKALTRLRERVLEAAGMTMLRPVNQSNRELKLAYGAANLTVIAAHEERFLEYGYACLAWAQALAAAGEHNAAAAVLKAAEADGAVNEQGRALLRELES